MIESELNPKQEKGVNSGLDYSIITRSYKITKVSFLLPLSFLAVGIIDASTFHLAGALFGALSVFSAAPGGIIGLCFSIKGLVSARKLKHNQYADTGIAFIFFG